MAIIIKQGILRSFARFAANSDSYRKADEGQKTLFFVPKNYHEKLSRYPWAKALAKLNFQLVFSN